MTEFPSVSEEEFRKVCEFLYRRTGMVFTESQALLRRSAASPSAWPRSGSSLRRLLSPACAPTVDGEIEQFINAFTVNETYFYREDHQLRCLTTDLLTERVRAKPAGEALRIWSVPCSTGEEPYSIAIWLLENWPEVDVARHRDRRLRHRHRLPRSRPRRANSASGR